MTMRRLSIAAGLGAVLATATPAQAVPGLAALTGIDLSGEAHVMSDYRFRGVSRSDGDPAVQAGLTLGLGPHFYVGARATSLGDLDNFRPRDPGDAQIDLYAGYQRELGAGFSGDAGVMVYVFPGAVGPSTYAEPYASLSYVFGPITGTAGAKYAPAQRAILDQDQLYTYAQIEVGIPFQPLTLTAEAGHQSWGAMGDYWNWSAGARYRIGPAELGARYVDTDLPAGPGRDATVVLSAGVRF